MNLRQFEHIFEENFCSTDLKHFFFKLHTELVNIFLGHLNKILFQKFSTDLKNNLQIFLINLFSSPDFANILLGHLNKKLF